MKLFSFASGMNCVSFLILLAFLLSFGLNSAFAAPTMSSGRSISRGVDEKDIEPLDADFPEMIEVIQMNNEINQNSFIITKEMAKKMDYFNKILEAVPNTRQIRVPKEYVTNFQWVIDYLNHPNIRFGQQWNKERLPDLVNMGTYLGIPSMVKDAIRSICCEFLTDKEANALFSKKMDVNVKTAILHCLRENPQEPWSIPITISQQEILSPQQIFKKQEEFRARCKLQSDLNVVDDTIYNAKPECLEYIRGNNLNLVLSPYTPLEYNDLRDFALSADLLKKMDVEIRLRTFADNVSLLLDSIKKVPNLADLKINNFEDMIDLSEFPDMPKLERLEITGCILTNIDALLCKQFPQLIKLNLSYNGLKDIGKIQSMPKLEHLDLYHNQLTYIDELMSSSFSNLVSLALYDNQIKAFPTVELKKLVTLDLDDNQICNASPLIQSKMPELRRLSMRKNPFKTLGGIKFMPNLQTLLIDKDVVRE